MSRRMGGSPEVYMASIKNPIEYFGIIADIYTKKFLRLPLCYTAIVEW